MKLKKRWALAAALLLAMPTYVAAGVGAVETLTLPNDKDGLTNNVASVASGLETASFRVERSCPDVRARDLALSGPMTGQEVGRITVNALCANAILPANGYTCNGIVDTLQCFGAGCCNATNDAATQRITCQKDCTPGNTKDPLQGFTLQRIGGSETFEVIPAGASVDHLAYSTDAGNTFIEDLLPAFNIGIDRNGVNGVFTATFATDPNDPNTQASVSVDSNDPNIVDPGASAVEQDQQLHQALADGIVALGLGLDVQCTPGYGAEGLSSNPDLFSGTIFLHIPNLSETPVTAVGLSGPVGATVTGETMVFGSPIPTLSEWGLVALVAVLVLTGFWMLRRRRLGDAI